MSTLLSRTKGRGGRPASPVRHVHLGLGAFHRAHQLAYTDLVDESNEWGVASFTGRRPDAAHVLAAQDGLYTLVERGPRADTQRVIQSLSHAFDGANVAQLASLLASARVAIVTLTITEAGYCLSAEGRLDRTSPAVAADLLQLTLLRDCSDAGFTARLAEARLTTVLARLVAALEARRRAHGEPISLVPCDNLPDNGALLGELIAAYGESLGEEFTTWATSAVSSVSTSVDRITPATTAGDLATVERRGGYLDRAVVVTEPFSDWVLSGVFRAGRPAWDRAGARFVTDLEPFENRKLWMLNGAHTLLANAGRLLGFETVAEAIGDETLLAATLELWDEAEWCLPGEGLRLDEYRQALLARFGNSRIEHRLDQIASDTATKLAVRVAPVAIARLDSGLPATASARAVAAWIAALESTTSVADSRGDEILAAREAAASDRPRSFVSLLSDELAQHDTFVRDVSEFLSDFQNRTTTVRSRT